MRRIGWLLFTAAFGCGESDGGLLEPPLSGSYLEIVAAPTQGVAGQLLAPVEVRLVVPQDVGSSPITIALFARRDGVEGFLGERRTSDRAIFDDLRLQAGTVILVARSEGLVDVETGPLTILPRPVALHFAVQPSAVVQDSAIAPAIEVEIVDASGARVSLDGVSIDLDWRGGGGRSAAAVTSAGLAVFGGVSGDQVRRGAILEASSPGLTTAVSDPFDVFAAPTSLAWIVPPPTTAFAGRPMPISVEALDADGDRIVDQPLTFLASVGEGTGQLLGTTTVRPANGVAELDDLAYTSTLTNHAPETIRIRVAVGLVTLLSEPIEILPAPPTMHRGLCPDGHGFGFVEPPVTISDDGHWITFHSTCLEAGEARSGLYRVDTRTGQSELLDGYPSVAWLQGDPVGVLSGDGGSMAFAAVPSLYGLSEPGPVQVLRRDFGTGTVEVWGYLPDGSLPELGVALFPKSVSRGGTAVVFGAYSSTSSAGFYLRVGSQPTVRLASITPIGQPIAAIAADAGSVVFLTADALVPADQDNAFDYYRYDVASGTTRLAIRGVGPDGSGGAAYWSGLWLDSSGSVLLFSDTSTMGVADTNIASDVFVAETTTGLIERVSVDALGRETVSAGDSGNCGRRPHSIAAGISGDGRFVLFDSCADNLIEGDTNGSPDVFVKDRQTGEVMRLNVLLDGTELYDGNGSSARALSADGHTAVITTDASIGTDMDHQGDLYWVDNPLAR